MAAKEVENIYERAAAGKKVSLSECSFLKDNLEPNRTFPVHCSVMLHAASKRGLLARRESRVQQIWKRGEHGMNRLTPNEKVAGGAMDNVNNPAEAESFHDIYMASKTPEQQQKIRQLLVRAASKGAVPRVDYDQWTGDKENQTQVVQEVRKELVRRASRREELRTKSKA